MDSAAGRPAPGQTEEARRADEKVTHDRRRIGRTDERHRREDGGIEEWRDAAREQGNGAALLLVRGVGRTGVQTRVQIGPGDEDRKREHEQRRGDRGEAVQSRGSCVRRAHVKGDEEL